jgi:predicted DNA-binding transcriptional regulator AlpA
VQIGPRAIGFIEGDVEDIIDELVAQRDARGGDIS